MILRQLRDKGVISGELLSQVKGLGGLRNILIHRYLDIDSVEVMASYAKGMNNIPRFARECWAGSTRSADSFWPAATYSTITQSLPLRPNTSGEYISSALAGGTTNVPGVVARAT